MASVGSVASVELGEKDEARGRGVLGIHFELAIRDLVGLLAQGVTAFGQLNPVHSDDLFEAGVVVSSVHRLAASVLTERLPSKLTL